MIDLYYEESSYFPSSLTVEEAYDLVSGCYVGAGCEEPLTSRRKEFEEELSRYIPSDRILGKRPNRNQIKCTDLKGNVRWISVNELYYQTRRDSQKTSSITQPSINKEDSVKLSMHDVIEGTYIKLFKEIIRSNSLMNTLQLSRLEAEIDRMSFAEKGIIINRTCDHAEIWLPGGTYIKMDVPFHKVSSLVMRYNHMTVEASVNNKKYLFAIIAGFTEEKNAVILRIMPFLVKGD